MKSTDFLKEANMSRAAKGHEKYGKEGMKALAKAGREGASEKKLDTLRDKHDKYNESYDHNEYHDEAGMIDSNLETIKRAAEELDQVLGQDDNMAEWAQEKLAVVKSMIVAVKDYVVSQKSVGIDPKVDQESDEMARAVAEDASGGGTSSGAVATSMGGGAGFGKSIFMSRTVPVKTKKVKK